MQDCVSRDAYPKLYSDVFLPFEQCFVFSCTARLQSERTQHRKNMEKQWMCHRARSFRRRTQISQDKTWSFNLHADFIRLRKSIFSVLFFFLQKMPRTGPKNRLKHHLARNFSKALNTKMPRVKYHFAADSTTHSAFSKYIVWLLITTRKHLLIEKIQQVRQKMTEKGWKILQSDATRDIFPQQTVVKMEGETGCHCHFHFKDRARVSTVNNQWFCGLMLTLDQGKKPEALHSSPVALFMNYLIIVYYYLDMRFWSYIALVSVKLTCYMVHLQIKTAICLWEPVPSLQTTGRM